jgi:hypothetical protein
VRGCDRTARSSPTFHTPARKRDLRSSSDSLIGSASIDAIAEVFNIFNAKNVTISTQEIRADFGTPTAGENRTAQFGFRLTF